jgi:hypothetical protein
MHAVVVRVSIKDSENATSELRERVVPGASQSPGFVAGYWTRKDDTGLSMIVFDSEESAQSVADRLPEMVPESVDLQGVEVREVVANA